VNDARAKKTAIKSKPKGKSQPEQAAPPVEEEVEVTEEDLRFFSENQDAMAFLDTLPVQQLEKRYLI